MWISVIGAVVLIGMANALIYQIYIKMSHPNVRQEAKKGPAYFVQDAFATLIQYEPPPNFMNEKCSCSSGKKE